MQLISFSVENFRSITNTRKIPLSAYSVLIGANNEGKSNILHALALGMDALASWVSTVRRLPDGRIIRVSPTSTNFRSMARYDWKTDFPVSKQSRPSADSCTKITLEFQLNDSELEDFKSEIKSNLNGTLPILISFKQDSFDLSVQKPGRGHAPINKKSARIADFVSRRIRFNYIPAIRTSDSASTIISRLVERELKELEDNKDYNDALEKIEALQRPIFNKLAETIQSTISNFLPSVKSVQLNPLREGRYRALRREMEILVDDGSLTKLSRKGDGVQSLAALALMRHASEDAGRAVSTIIAIEEPESHLHPRAIHELRSVIEAISENNQIVLTTHSPLFVRLNSLKSTVIVHSSKAKCAERVSEVRDALGVRFSDNLQNARVVLIVEGRDDVMALQSILTEKSKLIKRAILDGALAFDDLGGASSLSQKASFYQSASCQVQAFLDNDAEGVAAVRKATFARSIKEADVNLSTFPGKSESELEDLYDINVYGDELFKQFGVDIRKKFAVKRSKKWSEMAETAFTDSGKIWNENVKSSLKYWLAKFAAENPDKIVRLETGGSLLAFITSVEAKLAEA